MLIASLSAQYLFPYRKMQGLTRANPGPRGPRLLSEPFLGHFYRRTVGQAPSRSRKPDRRTTAEWPRPRRGTPRRAHAHADRADHAQLQCDLLQGKIVIRGVVGDLGCLVVTDDKAFRMASPGVLQSTRIKTTKGGVCIENLQKLLASVIGCDWSTVCTRFNP